MIMKLPVNIGLVIGCFVDCITPLAAAALVRYLFLFHIIVITIINIIAMSTKMTQPAIAPPTAVGTYTDTLLAASGTTSTPRVVVLVLPDASVLRIKNLCNVNSVSRQRFTLCLYCNVDLRLFLNFTNSIGQNSCWWLILEYIVCWPFIKFCKAHNKAIVISWRYQEYLQLELWP